MKKILQVIGSYPPAKKFGGGDKIMYEYAKVLSNNFFVEVYTQDVFDENERIDSHESSFMKENLKINYFRTFSTYLATKYNLSISFNLIKSIFKNIDSFDYVHLGELRGLTPLCLSIRLIFNKKIKFLHSGFGMLSSSSKKITLRSLFRRVYDQFFIALLIKRIDLAICESHQEIIAYREMGYKGDYRVLPHYVETPEDCHNEKNRYFSDTSDIRFLTITRLHPNKDITKSINFFKKFSDSCSETCSYLIVGDDQGDLKNINNYISTNKLSKLVKVIPPIYGEERFKIYKEASVFILLPKVNLETSLASIEALSQNCFIIFNNNSYIEEAEKNHAAFSVENIENYDQIRKKIINRGSLPEAFFEKKFSLNEFKNNLREIFN